MEAAERAIPIPGEDAGDVVEFGRQVIRTEAAALAALAGLVNDSFATAVTTLLRVRGRVVSTGIGKSGHIRACLILLPRPLVLA